MRQSAEQDARIDIVNSIGKTTSETYVNYVIFFIAAGYILHSHCTKRHQKYICYRVSITTTATTKRKREKSSQKNQRKENARALYKNRATLMNGQTPNNIEKYTRWPRPLDKIIAMHR